MRLILLLMVSVLFQVPAYSSPPTVEVPTVPTATEFKDRNAWIAAIKKGILKVNSPGTRAKLSHMSIGVPAGWYILPFAPPTPSDLKTNPFLKGVSKMIVIANGPDFGASLVINLAEFEVGRLDRMKFETSVMDLKKNPQSAKRVEYWGTQTWILSLLPIDSTLTYFARTYVGERDYLFLTQPSKALAQENKNLIVKIASSIHIEK